MKTLLQINVTSNWGSTGRIIEAIGIVAKKYGWDCYNAYGRHSNQSQNKILRIGDGIIGPSFHYAVNRLFDFEGRASILDTLRLIRKIKLIRPDVVQLHNIHDHYLNYPLLFRYLNKTDIKVVWTFHDCWAMTGHCCHFVESNCLKWQMECGECPMKSRFRDGSKENFLLKKELFASNNNLSIVPCSDWMADVVRHSFLKDKQILVIHNGIDLNVFYPSKEKIDDGKFRILAVSSVWPKSKGLDDICRLGELLPADYQITVVGLTDKQIKSLPQRIIGIKKSSDVRALAGMYSESDVLINTTYADTFPTVNLESLACGTPVITYRTGGSPEAIDEKTGVVVPQGDVNAMADAIRHMKKKPLSGRDCRKRAEEMFDRDKQFEKYIRLYNDLTVDNTDNKKMNE